MQHWVAIIFAINNVIYWPVDTIAEIDQIDNPSDYDNGREIYYKSVDYTNIVLQTKLDLQNS